MNNILSNQATEVMNCIQDNEFNCALRMLKLLLPLWSDYGYGHKYDELLSLIRERMHSLKQTSTIEGSIR